MVGNSIKLIGIFGREKVKITTDFQVTISTELGQDIIPLCYEVYFIDIDEEFVYVSREPNSGTQQIIQRHRVIDIEIIDDAELPETQEEFN